MNPNQLALQYKADLEQQGYVVDSQGRVSFPRTGSGFLPPWSWAPSIPALANQSVTLGGVNQGASANPYALTPGFAESAWHGMNQSNGPFSTPAAWNSQDATYNTSTDWGTLLGTAGVGSLFAAPALAGLLSGGGAAASGAGPLASGETGMAATDAALDGATAPASLLPNALPSAATVSNIGSLAPATTSGGTSALAGATSALSGAGGLSNALKALTTLGAALGGHAIASAAGSNNVPPQLSQLLDMAVQRQQQQQPIAQSVDQGMYAMLPNFAKTGTSMPNVPASPVQGLTTLLGGRTNG